MTCRVNVQGALLFQNRFEFFPDGSPPPPSCSRCLKNSIKQASGHYRNSPGRPLLGREPDTKILRGDNSGTVLAKHFRHDRRNSPRGGAHLAVLNDCRSVRATSLPRSTGRGGERTVVSRRVNGIALAPPPAPPPPPCLGLTRPHSSEQPGNTPASYAGPAVAKSPPMIAAQALKRSAAYRAGPRAASPTRKCRPAPVVCLTPARDGRTQLAVWPWIRWTACRRHDNATTSDTGVPPPPINLALGARRSIPLAGEQCSRSHLLLPR